MSAERQEITCPHADIENAVERRPLEYFVTLPDSGVNADTGLIFTICGYGQSPVQEYWRDKLPPYLADNHNCIVVGVNYFGCTAKASINPRPFPEFFANLREKYGMEIEAPPGTDVRRLLAETCVALAGHGITELDDSFMLLDDSTDEYHSFGLLPALDHLQVLGEMLTRYAINRKRLYVIGTSYGGYIGLLMGKLAPNTFRMIVDNSGFTQVTGSIYGINDMRRPGRITLFGVSILVLEKGVWSMDPASPHFFSPHHAMIRDLNNAGHMHASDTRYFCYHAVGDTVAPTDEKIRFRDMADGLMRVELSLIDEAGLDGRLFKTLEHGMQASLRGLFDVAYAAYQDQHPEPQEKTDFDLASQHRFDCGDKAYTIAYSPDGGVSARLE
ncbi:MAG: DUF2920 family protein [Alphaproteobacteria bacterium]